MTITITPGLALIVLAVCFCLGCWRAISIRQPDYGFDVHEDGCLLALASMSAFLVALGFVLARWWS